MLPEYFLVWPSTPLSGVQTQLALLDDFGRIRHGGGTGSSTTVEALSYRQLVKSDLVVLGSVEISREVHWDASYDLQKYRPRGGTLRLSETMPHESGSEQPFDATGALNGSVPVNSTSWFLGVLLRSV